MRYKPIRGLYFDLSYTNAIKGNDYDYLRTDILNIISQKALKDIIWREDRVELNAVYEVFNNCYARVNLTYNDTRSSEPKTEPIVGENHMTAQQALNKFTPLFYQGQNFTITCGLNFSF